MTPGIRILPTAALISIWIMSMPVQAALSNSTNGAVLPRPAIDLQPQDVVRIVINALANNDKPFADAGIETTFAFASPANKVNTGPLDRFMRMVKNDVYGIMVDHVESEFGKVVHDGNNAYQLVRLTGQNGVEIVFAFRLSKQLDGKFEGMWMTDAVWPVGDAVVPQQGF